MKEIDINALTKLITRAFHKVEAPSQSVYSKDIAETILSKYKVIKKYEKKVKRL